MLAVQHLQRRSEIVVVDVAGGDRQTLERGLGLHNLLRDMTGLSAGAAHLLHRSFVLVSHLHCEKAVCTLLLQPFYSPSHPVYASIGDIPDWNCDICGSEFAQSPGPNPYMQLFACDTFGDCDWVACATCSGAVPTAVPTPDWRAEVDALYRKYNPEKLGDVDQLAAQFGSGVLLTKVREKYAKHREERCQECEKHLIVSAPLPIPCACCG